MVKPDVSLIVCGRFHYHKFVASLVRKGILNQFFFSYKLTYDFKVPKKYLKNLFLKEYLMYAGRYFLKGKFFYQYVSTLHSLWQHQALLYRPKGNIGHFLVHGNCGRIIKKCKKRGMKTIGEVVNAHPHVQNQILATEYSKYGLAYESGDKHFTDKIIDEYSLCDYLLVPSVFLKNSLVGQGIAPEKIYIIPYGLNKFTGLVKAPGKINEKLPVKLLCVSQITFRKGIIYLCEAMRLLIKSSYRFELTLIGAIDPQYESIIKPYLDLPFISHIVHVDNSRIEKIMVENDLFIMPSIEDGFGIVVSEALSVHLPVIVTKNCGAAEVVVHGKDGFIVEPFSAAEIAGAVMKSIGYNFEFREEVFTWEDYVTRLEAFYSFILN